METRDLDPDKLQEAWPLNWTLLPETARWPNQWHGGRGEGTSYPIFHVRTCTFDGHYMRPGIEMEVHGHYLHVKSHATDLGGKHEAYKNLADTRRAWAKELRHIADLIDPPHGSDSLAPEYVTLFRQVRAIIEDKELPWRAKYLRVFAEGLAERMQRLHVVEWYDPETSYEESVSAFYKAVLNTHGLALGQPR